MAERSELSGSVINAAIEVHRGLGPGLLESTYQQCMVYELKCRGYLVESEVVLPVQYKQLNFFATYRMDIVVERNLVIELKAIEIVMPVHKAQLLSYLKMSGYKLGLLMNFNVPRLVDGIKRIINSSASL